MDFYRARTERRGHEGLSATMRATGQNLNGHVRFK